MQLFILLVMQLVSWMVHINVLLLFMKREWCYTNILLIWKLTRILLYYANWYNMTFWFYIWLILADYEILADISDPAFIMYIYRNSWYIVSRCNTSCDESGDGQAIGWTFWPSNISTNLFHVRPPAMSANMQIQ